MKKAIIFSVLFFLMTGLIYAKNDHVVEGKRLIEEEALFLNRKAGFGIFGCGGSFSDNIKCLDLTVETGVKCGLDECRNIFVVFLLDWKHRVKRSRAI